LDRGIFLGMTDKDVVQHLIQEIEEAISEMKKCTSFDEDVFIKDRTLRFSLRYSVIQAVESAADLGLTILEKKFNTTAKSYREVFRKLVLNGVISLNIGKSLEKMASLRNMIVHRYWDIDDLLIYRGAKEGGIETIKKYMEVIKEFVTKEV